MVKIIFVISRNVIYRLGIDFKQWEVSFKIALHALSFYNLRNKYEQILVKTIEFLVVN